MRPSPVAIVGFCAFFAWLPVVCLAPGVTHPGLRLCLALLSACLAAPAANRSLFCRGPEAVRRLVWRPDGRFAVQLAGGRADEAVLARASVGIGGALWLVLQGRRRYYVFLDRSRMPPAGWAALRRRLACQQPGQGPLG